VHVLGKGKIFYTCQDLSPGRATRRLLAIPIDISQLIGQAVTRLNEMKYRCQSEI
jgi:hypothetical protein